MSRLLFYLPPTVATLTGFVLRNAEEHPIPVKPLCVEVSDLTGSEPKPTSCQTHEPCLETHGDCLLKFLSVKIKHKKSYSVLIRNCWAIDKV